MSDYFDPRYIRKIVKSMHMFIVLFFSNYLPGLLKNLYFININVQQYHDRFGYFRVKKKQDSETT